VHQLVVKRFQQCFEPLKGHLWGVLLIHSSSVGQQNESLIVKFSLVHSMYCVTE